MILALESSCDETAVAVFDPRRGLVGEWVHSQIALHEQHGGVVPDLATREHLRHFAPLLERARNEVGWERISRIAVTNGPGLAACLVIGVAAAKALAFALRVPLVGANHLRGHVWSPFVALHAEAPADFDRRLAGLLPHLGLIVSGGNTLLFAIDEARRVRVLASTRDDAAGEALDKGAKLLGLGYPGGPIVERLAAGGRADAFDFPRGIGRRDELDFSFSGLKTSLRYRVEKMSPDEVLARRPDLCASYQQAVVDALARKTRAALAADGASYRSLGLSGGVANNQTLRAALDGEARRAGVPLFAAQPRHTGDNAGMIAFAAWADPDGLDRATGTELRVDPSAALA
ncbi:MAG: tRNA (adenosine(37)-N6)-threonylcarbamoyltransferase complex transferase subunit TsaD [Verrucomicrobia bacterium]|nr:tRNA (adenosine(37)-N6)-threonylcarbamoyltransferase complex transferase subunit TsaD [Verrucomicrobiota bacterium]